MTKRQYIFPTTSHHMMEQIIGAYYTAHSDQGVKWHQLVAVTNERIRQQDQSGIVSFLRDLDILRKGRSKGTHLLTPFGMEFGAAVVQHAPDTSKFWADAVRRSNFMTGIYQFVQGADYIELRSLKNEIIRRAGGTYDQTPKRQATTLVNILKTSGLIDRYKVGKEYRLRVLRSKATFVSVDRIYQLETLPRRTFDLSKLVELCKAINGSQVAGYYHATGILIRALLDHVPRIFGVRTFDEVIGSYGGPSFKKAMRRLNDSGRDVYDIYIHGPITGPQNLGTTKPLEVDIELDMLLEEIVKKAG